MTIRHIYKHVSDTGMFVAILVGNLTLVRTLKKEVFRLYHIGSIDKENQRNKTNIALLLLIH